MEEVGRRGIVGERWRVLVEEKRWRVLVEGKSGGGGEEGDSRGKVESIGVLVEGKGGEYWWRGRVEEVRGGGSKQRVEGIC